MVGQMGFELAKRARAPSTVNEVEGIGEIDALDRPRDMASGQIQHVPP
ncbi:hypothetical protein [Nocardia cyriacigeorgica]|nr:hypothetical protein [Nocardia cyriacigeorgica]